VQAPVLPRIVLQAVGGLEDDPIRTRLPALAAALGGLYIATPEFDDRCTHMIVVQCHGLAPI
jgi:hypothetical protein